MKKSIMMMLLAMGLATTANAGSSMDAENCDAKQVGVNLWDHSQPNVSRLASSYLAERDSQKQRARPVRRVRRVAQ